MAYLTSNPADENRYLCIYPAYINSKKTLAEGRRIPIEKDHTRCEEASPFTMAKSGSPKIMLKLTAVENPSCAEIRDVLTAAGMNVRIENKLYPREWNRDVQFRGRVRVQLKQETGSLCQEKFTSKKDVMFYVAEMIPKLKTRAQKSGGSDTGSQQGEGGKKGKKKKK